MARLSRYQNLPVTITDSSGRTYENAQVAGFDSVTGMLLIEEAGGRFWMHVSHVVRLSVPAVAVKKEKEKGKSKTTARHV